MVEEFKAEVLNPMEIQSYKPPPESGAKKQTQQPARDVDDYEYYSEDDDREAKKVKQPAAHSSEMRLHSIGDDEEDESGQHNVAAQGVMRQV